MSCPPNSINPTSTVQDNSSFNYITVINTDSNNIEVVQPVTNVVQIATGPLGPVGPQGPSGSIGPSGSQGPIGPVGPSAPFTYIGNNIWNTTSSIQVTGSFTVSGSNTFIGTNIFSGSLLISGSVYGNVTEQPVASNTSSIDISTANFFTITLGSSATTHISASNVRAGQSVNILVTTGTNSTASFSTNIKQPSGSFYLPTSGSGNKDILSLVAFDSSNLYLVAVNQML